MNLSPIQSGLPAVNRPTGWLQGAEVALQLIAAAQEPDAGAPHTGKAKPVAETGMAALLRYARQAQQLANPVVGAEVLPEVVGGGFADNGWSRSDVLNLSDLEPAYAAEAAALGATRVVRQTPPPLSGAAFQEKMLAYLDDAYAEDPAYLAARDAGAVTISRTIDLGFRTDYASFELYRGQEYLGSMGMGVGDPSFEDYWAEQNAAGNYLMVGSVDGYDGVASWSMQGRAV